VQSKIFSSRLGLASVTAIFCLVAPADAASVWKVIGPNSGVLYLGGSIHALKSTDYPLPSAYNRAFDASTRVVFEVDPKGLGGITQNLLKAGEYSRGDSLKNHVDPRTYDYLRRFFALLKVAEEKFAKLRPWYLALALQSPGLHGLSANLGVEGFLERRAHANSKPISGLESLRESVEMFSGLSDRESEALLLLTFVSAEHGSAEDANLLDAWRRGNVDAVTRFTLDSFHDFPSLSERLLKARNRNWIPKIEGYLRSGQTYFVITGAAHMGGPDGLLSLLRQRGYRVEQL
jgi:uncharacterized protein YbaP (TraB family)